MFQRRDGGNVVVEEARLGNFFFAGVETLEQKARQMVAERPHEDDAKQVEEGMEDGEADGR